MLKSIYLSIFFFILSILFTNCSNEVSREDVMKVHDEAMAELGSIRSSVADLKLKAVASPDSLAIHEVIGKLEEADEAMMQWMENYKEPSEELLSEFYNDQLGKIKIVAEKMYSSINEAKKYVE